VSISGMRVNRSALSNWVPTVYTHPGYFFRVNLFAYDILKVNL
jgi:hypothetical protein